MLFKGFFTLQVSPRMCAKIILYKQIIEQILLTLKNSEIFLSGAILHASDFSYWEVTVLHYRPCLHCLPNGINSRIVDNVLFYSHMHFSLLRVNLRSHMSMCTMIDGS